MTPISGGRALRRVVSPFLWRQRARVSINGSCWRNYKYVIYGNGVLF